MTLANIRDWLITLNMAENYYTNRQDNKKEKSLGVYHGRAASWRPVMAIGGIQNSSYDIMAVSLLLHWNRSYPESETAAKALWDALIDVRHTDIPGGQHIQFLQMTIPEPVYVATDAFGIHEFVINFNLYYRR